MSKEKKAMLVVFKMDKKMSTNEWRKRFNEGYKIIFDLPGLFFKSWWCNQEKGQWGAFYIFNSEADLQAYITSDLWLNKIPARYGVKPEVTILDPGPIIAMKTVTSGENSWITE